MSEVTTHIKSTYKDGTFNYNPYSEHQAKLKIRIAESYQNILKIEKVEGEVVETQDLLKGEKILQEIYVNKNATMGSSVILKEKDDRISDLESKLEAALKESGAAKAVKTEVKKADAKDSAK